MAPVVQAVVVDFFAVVAGNDDDGVVQRTGGLQGVEHFLGLGCQQKMHAGLVCVDPGLGVSTRGALCVVQPL